MDSNGSGPTPEKQLLKLIEQPQEADTQAETPRGAAAGALSPSAIRGRFSFLRGSASGYFKGPRKGIGLKGINKLLGAGALVLVLFLGWNVATSLNELKAMDPLEPEKLYTIDVEKPLTVPMTKEDYGKVFGGRNPFDFHREPVKATDDGAAQPTREELMQRELDALKDGLLYVGFRKTGGVLVATIRDTRAGARHKVKSGDEISGLKVLSVLREKVIVGFGELTAELPLGGQ